MAVIFRLLLMFLALSAYFGQPTPTSAAEGISIAVRPGFEGLVRAGTWLPIEVTLANQGRDISGELEVRVGGSVDRNTFGTPAVSHSVAVNLPRFAQKRYVLETYMPAISNQVVVRLVSSGTVVVSQDVQFEMVPSGEVLCGLLARNPAALDFLPGIALFARQRNVRLAHLDIADIPSRAPALGSLDCMVFADISTAPLTSDQATALEAWLSSGGLLIVAGGQSWQTTMAGFPKDLLPVRVSDITELPLLDSMVAFAGKPMAQQGPWLASRAQITDGNVVVAEGDVPLLVGARRGSGAVFYLALDPTGEPLRSWSGAAAVWRYLLSNVTATVPSQSAGRLSASWGRVPREALGDISAVDGPDTRAMVYVALVYLALVGPGSYLALRKLRRPEWSIWTTGAMLLVASAAALWIAMAGHEAELVGNKISVLRAWEARTPALMRTYVALLSNQQIESSIALPRDALAKSIFNPVYTKPPPVSQDGEGWALAVRESQSPEVLTSSLPHGSLVSFSTDSVTSVPLVSSTLTVTGRQVGGSITNNAERELRDVALMVGREVYRVGTLSAGQTANVSLNLRGVAPISYLDVGDAVVQLLPSGASAMQRGILEATLNSYSSYSRLDLGAASVLAWLADSPLTLTTGKARISTNDLTLLVISVPLRFLPGEVRIPADLIERRPMSSTQAAKARREILSIAAGDTVAEEYTMPIQPPQLDIKHLALDFAATINGRSDALAATALGTIHIFDWQQGNWAEQPLTFGINEIRQGHRFVSPLGVARVRYTYSPPDDGTMDQMDIAKFDIVVGGVVK